MFLMAKQRAEKQLVRDLHWVDRNRLPGLGCPMAERVIGRWLMPGAWVLGLREDKVLMLIGISDLEHPVATSLRLMHGVCVLSPRGQRGLLL